MMSTMPFRRRSRQLNVIHSRKNIVQDVAIIAAAATGTIQVANAVDNPVITATNQVTSGCKINTLYFEVWLYGNAVAGVNSPIVWQINKNPANQLVFVAPSSAGTSTNKRHIFAMGKGLVGASGNGQPGYLIRGWFSIPKSMRLMRFGDTIQLRIENNTANDLNVCRLTIYKWYE